MIPRLDIQFPFCRQWQYWFGKLYEPKQGEYLLNHARSGIVLALCASLPNGGRVGVVAYNCHTVANAVVNAGCTPVFVDVTDELKINVDALPADLDAIVVTNLFGIRNDISAIRKRSPQAIIIVDNAHGYGLPAEGDFTVYSINQGKFPALGEGGLLYAIDDFRLKIDDLYKALPEYGFVAQVKLFMQMLAKAIAYSPCFYWLVMRMKKSANPDVHETVVMKKMAKGVSRMYQAALPEIPQMIEIQRQNAAIMSERMKELGNECILGENAFMLVARTQNPEALKEWFAKQGVETATHFKHAIEWAKQFGYVEGSCPMAEKLVNHLLMVPTYF